MIKVSYQTNELLNYISVLLDKFKPNRVVWLGYSPGFSCVYSHLRCKGVEYIRIIDNDANKQKWTIKVAGYRENESIGIDSFENLSKDTNDTLYLSANTHYPEFVKQLSLIGAENERIIDLNSVLYEWMRNKESEVVADYTRLSGRTLQLEQLKILKWFRDFCDDNGLAWCLGEGTLLGAIRHEGFIPWDDDIDVFMPYEEYLRCIQSFPQGDDYALLDWRTNDRYPFQFAKVAEKGTYQVHPIPFGYFTLGCAIDIFPIAGYPANNEVILYKYKRNKELDAKWDASLILRDLYGDKVADCRQEITDEKYNIPFYESEYVGTMQQIAGNAWAIPQKAFSKTIMKKFEDDLFPVPIGYDEFLTARYGDYMIPPPVEKRRIHSYPTYVI